MSSFLYKLRFTAPVHFGPSDAALSLYSSEESFRADTLFSALCHTLLSADGETALESLFEAVRSGELKLSDAMPWRGDDLYLPKPFFQGKSSEDLPSHLRKAVKKLRWIPIRGFEAFSDSVHGGRPFVPPENESFGVHEEHTKAAVSEGEDTVPYQVGAFRFRDGCGLWFILCCPEGEAGRYEKLIRLLGLGGIGGELSSGYGSFEIEDLIPLDDASDGQTGWLSGALVKEGGTYLLLTSSLPPDEGLEAVLDGAFYGLIRRGGFIQSETYSDEPQKKDTQYFLASGSVLRRRFSGGLLTVGNAGNHKVYRYSSPVFLGVDL